MEQVTAISYGVKPCFDTRNTPKEWICGFGVSGIALNGLRLAAPCRAEVKEDTLCLEFPRRGSPTPSQAMREREASSLQHLLRSDDI